VSGQDESNPTLWLATRAGKMELFCPLGTTRRVPQEKFPRKPYNKSFIDQACSVKMAWYWSRSFFASLWTSTPSRSINTQKLGQYPAILNSHLVNDPCTFREEVASAFTGFYAGPLPWSNWNLEMLVFVEEGKPENTEKNPRSKARTNNKHRPHMAPGRNRTRAK